MAFQIMGLKMDAPGILNHLQNISKEETSCTLVSIGGEKMEVEFIFLCIFLLISRSKHSYWPPSAPSWRPCSLRCFFLQFFSSSFNLSTSSQAGSSTCISLPCSSSLLTSFITSMVDGIPFGEEQQ